MRGEDIEHLLTESLFVSNVYSASEVSSAVSLRNGILVAIS